jgi:sodium transport system ATP-binding protein
MIEVKNLLKQFGAAPNVVKAVNNVSFTAHDGQVTALLGPNGAGKTTSLRMISSLVRSDGGQTLVDGHNSQSTNPTEVLTAKSKLAMLSDARGLYQRLTAEENIAYYGELHGVKRADIRSRTAQLAKQLDFEALLGRKTEGFSTGEKMKVSIARAIIHDPRNVIFDEPTNGLDVMTTRAVRTLLRSLREQGRCVLLTSHIMQEVAQLADRIVIIAQGQIVADGTTEELLALSGQSSLEEAFVKLSGIEETH